MGKITGFLEVDRKDHSNKDPQQRINSWDEFHVGMKEEDIRDQAARCMDCGVPFCHTTFSLASKTSGCPVNNLIPEWNDMVYRGQWQMALQLLLKTNNFPEFTGRVCPAPCEGSCVLSINAPAVTIKHHEYAIIERAFDEGWIRPCPPLERTGKLIAIIGSGPSGLAAADQLNKKGHSVSVYERADRPGGLLMYGIPNMKLDKRKVVERRIDIMRQEGIVFINNTEIGKDVSLKDLQESHDAIILCTGATHPRDLRIPGRTGNGIHFAMEFLHKNTKSLLDSNHLDQKYISARNKNVVVIGGGDTGTDCVATALRHQCKSVTQLEILERPPEVRMEGNPWPEYPNVFILDYGQEESKAVFGRDPRRYRRMTQELILDEQEHVKSLKTVEVRWKSDSKGGIQPEPVPGTEDEIPADLVLLSMGFLGPEQTLLEQNGITTNQRSNVVAEYGKFTTNIEGIFAAGDCRRGQSLVVWAINEGRAVAEVCEEYLSRIVK